jgi:hypothetical protein
LTAILEDTMKVQRRKWLRWTALGLLGARAGVRGEVTAEAAPEVMATTLARSLTGGLAGNPSRGPLTITGLRVTPIALPDPPLLYMGGATDRTSCGTWSSWRRIRGSSASARPRGASM